MYCFKTPETRSRRAKPINTNEVDVIKEIKEKIDELKPDLSSEIKELINLEVEKAIKKQKRNLNLL